MATEPGEPGHRQPYPLKAGDIVSVRATIIEEFGEFFILEVHDSTDDLGLSNGPQRVLVPKASVKRSISILQPLPEETA